MNKLRIHSYNCKSLQSSIHEIQELCENSDIILLQETWLRRSELYILNQIHAEFCGSGISAMDTESSIHTGRPHGGLAIMWRKTLSEYITPIDYSDTRIQGIVCTSDDRKLLVLNVYMPCSNHENLELFSYYLTKLDGIITSSNTSLCMIMGDFNADLKPRDDGKITHLFGRKLLEYCNKENLCISDLIRNSSDSTYTFFSASQGSTSWLDHCICTWSTNALVNDIGILYQYITSDHFPMYVVLDLMLGAHVHHARPESSTAGVKVRWNKLTANELDSYKMASHKLLREMVTDYSLIECRDPNCINQEHTRAIDKLYSDIVATLHLASESHQSRHSHDKSQQVPGWNEYCKELHSIARDAFLLWRRNGSPRSGPVFEAMSRSRAQFKRTLRQCRADEERLKSDSIAKKLLLSDMKQFWNEVNSDIGKNVNLTTNTINGVTGSVNICNMWKDHFSNLLNSYTNKTYKKSVIRSCSHINENDHSNVLINVGSVLECIKGLKKGKTPGSDNISSEHLIYADAILGFYLSCLFNGMITHGYLPTQFMDTTIITLVKDKKGLLCDKDNYRPIAITSAISKLFELIVLDQYKDNLKCTPHQFGFMKGQSTDMCVFAMKEVIDLYNSLSSPVYLCFLDASKAFDKINHWCLFHKLLQRNMPRVIVRLLMVWYKTQTFKVRWDGVSSEAFNVSNGVRQGGYTVSSAL